MTMGFLQGFLGSSAITPTQSGHITTAARRQPVATIAALKALTPSAGDAVNVLGYAASGDGGAGTFYYDSASAVADNGGTVIAPNAGSGRWIRAFSGPVNVRWFGAKGDGATNDTSAWQAAMNASTSVFVPSGSYVLLDCTIPQAGCSILAEPGANVMVPRGAATAGLYFTGAGLYSAAVAVSAVSTETGYQGQSVTKITGAFSGFSPGDLCVITSAQKNTAGCPQAESFRVLDVAVDNTYILATRMLVDTYDAVANSTYVRRATSTPKVSIKGLSFYPDGDTTQAGTKSVLLRLRSANFAEVDCHFGGAWNIGLLMEGGYRNTIRATFNNMFVDYDIDAYGYVVNLSGPVYRADVTVNGDRCGHAFVSGASESDYSDSTWYNFGIPFGHVVHDSVVSNTRRAAFDEHFGFFGRFQNCVANGMKLDQWQNAAQNFGFAISGLNTAITNCSVYDARGFLITGSKDYGRENRLSIHNPRLFSFQSTGVAGVARFDAAVPDLMYIMVYGGAIHTTGDGYGDGYKGRVIFNGTSFFGCTRMFRLYSANSEATFLNCTYYPNASSNNSCGRMDLSSQIVTIDNFHVAVPSEVGYVIDVVQVSSVVKIGRVTCPTALTRFTGQAPVVTDLVTAAS